MVPIYFDEIIITSEGGSPEMATRHVPATRRVPATRHVPATTHVPAADTASTRRGPSLTEEHQRRPEGPVYPAPRQQHYGGARPRTSQTAGTSQHRPSTRQQSGHPGAPTVGIFGTGHQSSGAMP